MPTLRTVTVKPSGGDYTSLSAAETAERANLVSLDRQLDIACYAMSDPGNASFGAGWTTDATRYIRVYTPATERHAGVWSTSKYRIETTSGTTPIFADAVDLRLEGLQIHQTTATTTEYGILLENAQAWISQCLIRLSYTGTGAGKGIYQYDAGTGSKWWNNIVYFETLKANTVCIEAAAAANAAAYNNTVVRGAIGFNNAMLLKNNLAQLCTDGYSIGFNAASTNNGSDIALDAPALNRVTGSVSFVDAAGNDFHLAPTDTVARRAGIGLSLDATIPFSIDVDGQLRQGAWDIGADQVFRRVMLMRV